MTRNDKVSLLPKSGSDALVDELNKQYAVVLRGNQALIMRHWTGDDGINQLRFFDRKSFELLLANRSVVIADKPYPLSKLWLQSPLRKEYEDVYFRPDDKIYPKRYNLWKGFAVDPSPEGSCNLFLIHTFDNIANGDKEIYEWIINWLALLIQKPWLKCGTALILRGEMGIGKGVFARCIGKLFGIHYIPISHSSQLTGRFNNHLAGKVLIFMDEGSWDQDKYGAGVIRNLITEPEITVEGKGRDAVSMENHTHLIVAANDDFVVPVGMDDERRMACIDCGNAKKEDIEYFAAIQNQMQNGGYESLLHFLQNYKIDERLARTIPKTQALLDQKLHSMPHEAAWLNECLHEEHIGNHDIADYESEMNTDDFYKCYLDSCHIMKVIPLPKNFLIKKLAKYVTLVKKRPRTGIGRETVYVLQTLEQMRAKFEAAIGHKIDWNEFSL